MEKENEKLRERQIKPRQESQRIVKEKKKKSGNYTMAIVALSILLGLSLIFGVTAAFFGATKTATGTITLGDPVDINITQGGTTVTTLLFSGNAMPGTEYSQPIAVAMPANTSDAVIRGKLTITNSDSASVNVTATTNADWASGEDGYYYYNGKVSAGQSKQFITKLTVPTSLTNDDANKTYAISVQIEAIQFANGAAAEVWTTAPTAWKTAYGSGTIA